MSQSNGFLQFLREQFVPRNQDGSIDRSRIIGRAIGSALGGPIGGLVGGRIGGMDFSNFMSQLQGGARGVGTSFGRMFDNDPRTGFFNNPTAPWNTGRTTFGPDNPGVGHPDFVGPPAPSGGSQYSGPPSRGYGNQGMTPEQAEALYNDATGGNLSYLQGGASRGQQGGGTQSRTTTGRTGLTGAYSDLGHLNAALRFVQTNPSAWRGFGVAGRLGVGGNQNSGIGPFGMDSFQHTRGEIQGFTGNIQ